MNNQNKETWIEEHYKEFMNYRGIVRKGFGIDISNEIKHYITTLLAQETKKAGRAVLERLVGEVEKLKNA